MAKLKISSGDLIEIKQLNQKDATMPYLSVVESFDNIDTVLVNSPISSRTFVKLPQTGIYLIRFISKKGIFSTYALIKNYVIEGTLQFTEFKLFGKSKQIQQRNYFRLQYLNEFNFHMRKKGETGLQFSDETQNGIIRDLSGGGIKFVAAINLHKYDIIKFNLQIEDKNYELIGEIILKTFNLNSVYPFTYGVMFFGLSEAERDKIILFIHKRQLKMLQ